MCDSPLFAFRRIRFSREAGAPPLLADINLSLDAEERVGILGKNGSGKSTLLHIGAGLLQPDYGQVLYEGKVCRTEKDFVQARKKLGYLLQQAEDQLFCSSVLEDVAFGPYNLGCSAAQAEEKARCALRAFSLEHLAGRNGRRLSGGEQKLAALASILVMDVSLLFLDEPTNNLDEGSRNMLLSVLDSCRLPAIVVSHDLPFLLAACTSFYLLEDGVLRSVPRSSLLLQP
jgi:cobalt/nickel transport system ATP-binding protein